VGALRGRKGPHRQPVRGHTVRARINHWITAISLVLLALSGLSLFHPSLFFLTGLFGGGQWTRAIHPWIGVVLFVSICLRRRATMPSIMREKSQTPECFARAPTLLLCGAVLA
jgi:cytochrome b subunit of formate dehydrogenase